MSLTKQNRMSILVCMVRTRKFDPDTTLSKAVEIFSQKGYAETSMEDIVQATGVSRYGLYGTFGNKRELFEQALDRFAESMGKRSFLKLMEPDASIDHIRQIFDARVADMSNDADKQCCLFIHTAMELAPQDEELREVLKKFMSRMSRLFAAGLESAKKRGETRADLDAHAGGEMLTSAMFGLAVLGRAGFSRQRLDAIVDSTLESLT